MKSAQIWHVLPCNAQLSGWMSFEFLQDTDLLINREEEWECFEVLQLLVKIYQRELPVIGTMFKSERRCLFWVNYNQKIEIQLESRKNLPWGFCKFHNLTYFLLPPYSTSTRISIQCCVAVDLSIKCTEKPWSYSKLSSAASWIMAKPGDFGSKPQFIIEFLQCFRTLQEVDKKEAKNKKLFFLQINFHLYKNMEEWACPAV